jgi:multicomponent Na+:H+ antiporter subunit E
VGRAISLGLWLFVFWLLLSGQYEPFFVLAGAGCSIGVVLLSRRMDVLDQEGHPIRLGLAAPAYWLWLAKEIVKSAWDVTRIIVHPRLPIAPTLVRFAPSQCTPVGLATHANSITLTPGTISVEVARREFLVHALTREGAAGVEGSEMDARVAKLERLA